MNGWLLNGWRLRWGDALVIVLGLVLVGASFVLIYPWGWQSAAGEVGVRHLVIVQAGQPVQRIALFPDRELRIVGPAGTTEVEIRAGRARCLRSPGNQGICEHAGWLEHAGELAVSLPNRLVLQIEGGQADFDSILY